MSGSVLYIGQEGPLFAALGEALRAQDVTLNRWPGGEGGGLHAGDHRGELGSLAADLKGYSGVVAGRGAGISDLEALLGVLGEARVPALVLSEDGPAVARALGGSLGAPVILAGGPAPGLGAALLSLLLERLPRGGGVTFSYGLSGMGPFTAEYLRGALGRPLGEGGAGEGVPIPSGEVGALAQRGLPETGGAAPTLKGHAEVRCGSRRLRSGLRALATAPGAAIVGRPGETPDPEALLSGRGGSILARWAPEGEGLEVAVTLRGQVRTLRGGISHADGAALAQESLGALMALLIAWRAPIGISTPLHPQVSSALWGALIQAGIPRPALEDLPHVLDPRAARRLHILAP